MIEHVLEELSALSKGLPHEKTIEDIVYLLKSSGALWELQEELQEAEEEASDAWDKASDLEDDVEFLENKISGLEEELKEIKSWTNEERLEKMKKGGSK